MNGCAEAMSSVTINASMETSAASELPARRKRSKRRRHASKMSGQIPTLAFFGRRTSGTVTAISIAIVGVAMILGGGGSSAPRTETLLQILMAGVFATAFVILPNRFSGWRVHPSAWFVIAPLLSVPVLQLVPLPPALWRNFPGRDGEVAVLDMIGAGSNWMPISMAPPITLASLITTLTPVAVMLFVARLDVRERAAIGFSIVGFALLSVSLGALQLSHFGGASWSLYADYSVGWLVGFQANRNAETDVLQIALMASALVGWAPFNKSKSGLIDLAVIFCIAAVLALGAIMTGSRAGLVLLTVSGGTWLAILWPRLTRRIAGFRWWLTGIVASGILSGYALSQVSAIQRVAERFDSGSEGRWDFWADTLYAARRVWPFGSGVGTFPWTFEAAERLEMVSRTYPMRAHNDWLEWTLEAGIFGWIATAATLVGIVCAVRISFRLLRNGKPDQQHRGQILFGVGVLLCESLHAIVDYPTRSMALASLIGIAVAYLIPPPATCNLSLEMSKIEDECRDTKTMRDDGQAIA